MSNPEIMREFIEKHGGKVAEKPKEKPKYGRAITKRKKIKGK